MILDKTNTSKVVGVDVLARSVQWAKKHWGKNQRLKFMVADAHSLPFKAGRFDAVIALEVLEHVYEPEKVLKEIESV